MKTIILLSSILFSFGVFAEDTGLSQMLKDAKMVPHIENGKVVGYKMAKVKKGSKWEKMGLKKGDVIKSINGQPVNSPTEAMELYTELKEGDDIQVEKENN